MSQLHHDAPAGHRSAGGFATSGAGRTGRLLRALARRLHARSAEEGGQALVEFILVLSVLALFLFGITQFGLALNTANDETHLANEVARYAAVNYDPASGGQSLSAWAKSQADTTFISSGGQVCITFPNGTSNIGDPVQVDVKTNIDWQPVYGLSQLLGGAFPASSTVSGTAVMRLEAAPSVYSSGCS